jgi:MarR family transcriptional repressor of emrRAB
VADDRLANILGALAVGVVDGIGVSTERAALVGLSDLLERRSIDDLRRAVGLTHSGGVRVVDRLVAGGLVERRRGRDGRSIALVLTDEGRRAAGDARAARLATVHDLLAVLDDHEREALAPILEKLIGAVVAARLEARVAGVDPAGGWLCRLCDPVACERAQGRCPAANAAAGLAR